MELDELNDGSKFHCRKTLEWFEYYLKKFLQQIQNFDAFSSNHIEQIWLKTSQKDLSVQMPRRALLHIYLKKNLDYHGISQIDSKSNL